jgi:hypothetical protein
VVEQKIIIFGKVTVVKKLAGFRIGDEFDFRNVSQKTQIELYYLVGQQLQYIC